MSNASEKIAIANVALTSIGGSRITALDDADDVNAIKINAIFEKVVKGLLADDWNFNRERVQLEIVYKLTVDASPTPAAWSVGATLTGATSGATCTVLKVISSTVYWVTEPSTDWTDGEVISDGTNSRDCAADYPESTDKPNEFGTYEYVFQLPSDQLYIRGLGGYDYDKIKYRYQLESNFLLTNQSEAYFHYNKKLEASADVSDVTLMREWFHDLISARIAFILSANITTNQKIRTKAEIDYDRAYHEAKEKNGEETFNEFEHQGNYDVMEGANRELELL